MSRKKLDIFYEPTADMTFITVHQDVWYPNKTNFDKIFKERMGKAKLVSGTRIEFIFSGEVTKEDLISED